MTTDLHLSSGVDALERSRALVLGQTECLEFNAPPWAHRRRGPQSGLKEPRTRRTKCAITIEDDVQ